MRKAIVILVVISLVLTGFLMLPVPGEQENEVSSPSETRDSARGNTLYVGVGQEYSEILYAVEDASAGDTIRVYAGTYYKGFELNKKMDRFGFG